MTRARLLGVPLGIVADGGHDRQAMPRIVPRLAVARYEAVRRGPRAVIDVMLRRFIAAVPDATK